MAMNKSLAGDDSVSKTDIHFRRSANLKSATVLSDSKVKKIDRSKQKSAILDETNDVSREDLTKLHPTTQASLAKSKSRQKKLNQHLSLSK